MDDNQKDAVAGGATLAAIGGIIGGPPGAVIGGLAGAVLGGQESDHNEALRTAAYQIKDEVGDSGMMYVDHIQPDGAGDGGTRKVLDELARDPDIIYVSDPGSGHPNLILEVETADSLQENPAHVVAQLEDFRVNGFKRALVVPDESVDAAVAWQEEQDQAGRLGGVLRVTGASDVGDLV